MKGRGDMENLPRKQVKDTKPQIHDETILGMEISLDVSKMSYKKE